jgi:hypothetical protein
MKRNHTIQSIAPIVLAVTTLFFFALLPVAAQDYTGNDKSAEEQIDPVSKEELRDFVSAYIEVQELQIDLQSRNTQLVEESEIEPERFHRINEAVQNGDAVEDLKDVSEKELEEYNVLVEELTAVQEDMHERMVEAISDAEMSVERFNEIANALQSDQELAVRAQSYYEEELESREDG